MRDNRPSNDINPAARRRDPTAKRLIERALANKVRLARTNVVDFFELVVRHGETQRPLKAAAHQRVMFDFVDRHDRCQIIAPPKFGKTFLSLVFTLRLLGQNPSSRGMIVSASEAQAKKPLNFVRDYLEHSELLRLVYPNLRPSTRAGDPWTQTALTVERPYGVRDPSLVAVGFDSTKVPGSRLNWIVVDDLLTSANTNTKEQRDKVHTWLDSTVQARCDETGARLIVLNTAWHPDDLVHRYEQSGWPTLRMSIDGTIDISTPPNVVNGESIPDVWGSDGDPIGDELRAANEFGGDPANIRSRCRLAAHDKPERDVSDQVPLWPEVFNATVIERIKSKMLPVEFNRVYRQVCRDDDTAMCKVEWIENCKRLAREAGIFSMQSKPTSKAKWCVIGVDLAVSPGETHDDTALVTFEVWDDGTRVLLDVDCGQFDGPTTVGKIIQKWEQYCVAHFDPLVMVENNNAQDFIRQFTRVQNKLVPITGLSTGRAKHNPDTGVVAFFIELQNGVWLIPNDKHGICHKNVQRLINACLYYTPTRHTDDALMAMYMARERARRIGIPSGGNAGPGGGGLGFDFMAR